MNYLELDLPEEPEIDCQTFTVINTFWLANRSRAYVSGMAISPLPLTVVNISDVLAVYPVPMIRECLDKAVFAIDDLYLERIREEK